MGSLLAVATWVRANWQRMQRAHHKEYLVRLRAAMPLPEVSVVVFV